MAFAAYEQGMIVARTQTYKTFAHQDPNYREGRHKKYTRPQLQHALELLDSGKTYKQVLVLTGISKRILIRTKRHS